MPRELFENRVRSHRNGGASFCGILQLAARASRVVLSCDRSEPLPTCQAILNVIGDFLADSCQVEEFLLGEGIFGLFGKLPIP